MKQTFLTMLVTFMVTLLSLAPNKSEAALIGSPDYNDTITAIFGTGNPDGSWVSATGNGATAALRFRERLTTNMNNDGVGTFQFPLGTDISIDFGLNSGTALLSNYVYGLGIDIDPSSSQMYTPFFFDPILAFGDNSYGNSGTANGAGIEGSFLLAASNSVAQNSQRLSLFGIDTSVPGEYTSILGIYSKGRVPQLLAQSEVTVIVGDRPTSGVPDAGGTLCLSSLALSGLMLARKKMASKN